MGHGERALQVDTNDGVEVGLRHLEQHAVAEDPGVVDQHVELPEAVDRLLDQVLGPVPVGHVVVVGGRLAALATDDLGHRLGRPLVSPLAGDGGAHVVDDDLGALLGQQQRLAPPDAVPGTGDDRDLPVDQTHSKHPSKNTDAFVRFTVAALE